MRGHIGFPTDKPTSFWLAMLRKRRERMYAEKLDLREPIRWTSEEERIACIRFFNAAYRAEESGRGQAHALADEVESWDAELAECLRLYGDEEGWHKELLEEFIPALGGSITPMRTLTRVMYGTYGRAKRMDTILLTNLMFETIGSTTYRIALGRVKQPQIRQMLTILTRDESFHVPLNVHFLNAVWKRSGFASMRVRMVYNTVLLGLVASAKRSRKAAGAFDHIGFKELAQAYVENIGKLFVTRPDLGLMPPRPLLFAIGLDRARIASSDFDPTSLEAALRAVDREKVEVSALLS
ncbi:MAG: ferritin-like domain-containing protein [Polyangiaceae bacterium]